MWKPFDSRFSDLLLQMREHRRVLFEEISLYTAQSVQREIAQQAADREIRVIEQKLNEKEREQAAKERGLAQEERRLVAEEREQRSETRDQTLWMLAELRREMENLEKGRIGT